MKRTLAALAIVLALCSSREAPAQDDAPFDVRMVVPVPLRAEVAEAVGQCLAQAIREVPLRDRAAEDFQVGEVLLPRNVGERITIKGDATPWKKTPASGGGKVLEVADRGVLTDVRGGATWLKVDQVVRLEEVADQLTAVLRDKPSDATLLLARACLNGLGERPDEAIADLDTILRDEPRRTDCLLLRAVLHRKADRDEAALADWTKAIEQGEELEFALRSRARSLLWLNREDEAIADYERLLKFKPADIGFYTEFAVLRLKRGDSEGACELLRRAGRTETNDPTDVAAVMAVLLKMDSEARLLLGDDEPLAELLKRGPNMPAGTAEQFVARGLLRGPFEGIEAAIADWTRALEIDPKCEDALTYRALHFHKQKRWDEAIRDMDSALAIAPQRGDYLLLRAACYAAKDDVQQATKDVNTAIELNPNNAQALAMRAMLRCQVGEYSKAIDDLAAANRADPSDGQAQRELAWIWATCPDESLRNAGAAAHAASLAFRKSSHKERDFEVLASACAAAEVWDSAITAQERLLAMNPDDAEFQAKHRERLALYRDKRPYREQAKQRLADKPMDRILE